MAGRQAFLEILQAAGAKYIIGNPGTTELPLMDILVDYPELHHILPLQEGAERPDALQQALRDAMQRPGPTLLDVPLEADFPVA
jgi:benzoylformate decarboxylase